LTAGRGIVKPGQAARLDLGSRAREDKRLPTVVEPANLVGRSAVGMPDGDDYPHATVTFLMDSIDDDPVTDLSEHDEPPSESRILHGPWDGQRLMASPLR
jgi:hypothetical protein